MCHYVCRQKRTSAAVECTEEYGTAEAVPYVRCSYPCGKGLRPESTAGLSEARYLGKGGWQGLGFGAEEGADSSDFFSYALGSVHQVTGRQTQQNPVVAYGR
jgi:hypothetical protein